MSSDSSTKKPLRRQAVVGSFIFKYPDQDGRHGKPQVALFRRSDKVNTYRHSWAGISGSIEKDDPSPYQAALRELLEETTLTLESLEFIRQGKSYSFVDEDLGREWTIHPFGFRLKTASEGGKGEAGIKIDWEHEGWDWHDPLVVEDNSDFGGVPRLAESLRRVWFEKDLGEEAGAILADGLYRLKKDHESGARQLAGEALAILKDVVAALDADEPTDIWWANVRFAAWHIWKNGRESMGAAIMNVLFDALKSIEETMHQHQEFPNSTHSLKWRDSVQESLERLLSLRAANPAGVVSAAFLDYLQSNFADKIETKTPLSILTLSESSTIAQSLQLVAQKSDFSLDLRVLESRPLYEGVSLAGSVAQGVAAAQDSQHASKVKITVYTDASAALAADGVDVVVIGADRIASSGAVSNKTGSLPAVLSAKYASPSAKTVVLGESEKVAPPGDPREHVVEENDPAQLVRAWKAKQNSDRVKSAAGELAGAVGGGLDRTRPQAAGGLVAVQIRNVFFEWVPPDLIDAYVTEFGVWTVEDVSRHSENLGAEEQRLFEDL